MDTASNSDESYDLGYQPSLSSVDQTDQSSLVEESRYSMVSGESCAYCRTNSEASGLSCDDSVSEVASPLSCSWKGLKSPARIALSRLGMRPHRKHGLDDEIMDLGEILETLIHLHLMFSCGKSPPPLFGIGSVIMMPSCRQSFLQQLIYSVIENLWQSWSWWKRDFQSFCWEKTCLGVGKGFALPSQSQMP